MNNKDFKSSYSDYIKAIKPSQELIDSTIKLAHQHQEALRSEKTSSNSNATTKMLSNLSFKQYSALACMIVFAVFAVKLWSGLSNEKVPTLPSETYPETTTVEEYQGSQEFTTVSDSLEYPDYTTNVSNFQSDTDYFNEYTTNDYEQYIDTLTAEPNETNVPSSNLYSTSTDVTTNMDTSVTTVPTYHNQQVDNTSHTTTHTHAKHSTTSASTTAVASQTSNSTTVTTKATTVTTPKGENVATTNTQPITIPQDTTLPTTIDSNDQIDLEVSITEEPPSDDNVVTSTPRKVRPMITTIPENTWEATTKPPTNDPPDESQSASIDGDNNAEWSEDTPPITIDTPNTESTSYLALKVALYQNINGFYYCGNTYYDRIIDSLSFGNCIDAIIPLNIYNRKYDGYEHLLVINMDRLASENLMSTIDILNDIVSCEYISSTPISWEFLSIDSNDLDFNGDGIGATYDKDDKNTLLAMLSIT